MTDPRWQTLPEATRIRWIRVLDDITPGNLSVMSRWALHTAAQRGETRLISPLVAFAMRWHDWGFSPDDWWLLINALDLEPHELVELDPSAWAGWPALLADHAPRSAVKALIEAASRPAD